VSLRRLGPRNPILAVLFWVVLAALLIALLFTAFWYLDRFLPGGGMF
jgi:hypothetical protein